MVQHIWCDSRECDIHAPTFTHKFTLGSQIHDNVKFAQNSYDFRTNFARISCEFVRIGPNFVLSLLSVAHIGY